MDLSVLIGLGGILTLIFSIVGFVLYMVKKETRLQKAEIKNKLDEANLNRLEKQNEILSKPKPSDSDILDKLHKGKF